MAKKERVKFHGVSWLNTRRKVFKRDRYQCKRCSNFFGEDGLMLQAHHIIPRQEGGKTVLKNLISLCSSCHDYIELNPDKIYDLFPALKKEKSAGTDWRKWVYGGYKRNGE